MKLYIVFQGWPMLSLAGDINRTEVSADWGRRGLNEMGCRFKLYGESIYNEADKRKEQAEVAWSGFIRKRDRESKDSKLGKCDLEDDSHPPTRSLLPIYRIIWSFNGTHITSLLTTLCLSTSDSDGPGNCREIERSN